MSRQPLRAVSEELREIGKRLQEVERCSNRRLWEVFRDWIECCAIAISNAVDLRHREAREAIYMRHVERYGKEAMSHFAAAMGSITVAMERERDDLLGKLFMSLEFGNEHMGQFFTPYHLCETMSLLTFDKEGVEKAISEKGYVSVNDPACGAGGQLVAFVSAMIANGMNPQVHLHAVGQDLDVTCVYMTYVQLSLLGIPAVVYHMNTLSMETFSVWRTHFHVLHGWEWRVRRENPNPETEEASPGAGKRSDVSGSGSPPDLGSRDQSAEASGEARGGKTRLAEVEPVMQEVLL